MLQQDAPDDYVIATGETHSVREFIEKAFACVGIGIGWQGSGVNETGIDAATGAVLIKIDPRYFRPTEVEILKGDPGKALRSFGWKPQIKFEELVRLMVAADMENAGK